MNISHILDNFAFNITHLSPTGNKLKHVSILRQSFKAYIISFIFLAFKLYLLTYFSFKFGIKRYFSETVRRGNTITVSKDFASVLEIMHCTIK